MSYAIYVAAPLIASAKPPVRLREGGIEDLDEARLKAVRANKSMGAVGIIRLVDEAKNVLLEIDGREPQRPRGPLGQCSEAPGRWDDPYLPAKRTAARRAEGQQFSLF